MTSVSLLKKNDRAVINTAAIEGQALKASKLEIYSVTIC